MILQEVKPVKPQSLVVNDFGVFVGKKSERVVLKKDSEVIKEVPFFNLKEILISGRGVSFSSDVIKECAKAGIQIDFVSCRGKLPRGSRLTAVS